jgi:hypothetical protein
MANDAAASGPAIGALLCVLGAGLTIGTLVGAMILRAAVSLYNSLAGGDRSPIAAPEPDFGSAMGITFITSLVQVVVSFGLGLATGIGGAAAGAQVQDIKLIAQLISVPVSVLVMATMLTAMLPTTFPRAILIVMCYWAVGLLVAALILTIVFAFAFVLMRAT